MISMMQVVLHLQICMSSIQSVVPMTYDEKFKICTKIIKERKE